MNPDIQPLYNQNSNITGLLQNNRNIEYIDYKISSDCKTIIIKGETYNIPDWYNKNMILIFDNKTLEMILIGIINNKIAELENYKSRLK